MTMQRKGLRFLTRQPDGSVRVRMKWNNDEATMIEEAAGEMPPVDWLYKTVNEAAAREVREARQQRTIAPPKEQA